MRLATRWLWLLAACGGTVGETLVPAPFEVSARAVDTALQAAPSFADERGGGVFLDLAGRAVRVRVDGSWYLIESHPGNAVAAGPGRSVWPLGPFSALVATSKGLFVAEAGWLIAPAWREVLDADGLVATALGDNGVAWIAHQRGLFRLEEGALHELKEEGQSISGITALAIAPGHDGAPGVWFSRNESLSYAQRTSTTGYVIRDSRLEPQDLKGGIAALAGLAASPKSPGELWAITRSQLWRFEAGVWRVYELLRAAKELRAAGRVLWLRSGNGLFRYDADAQAWGEARGLDSSATLLAADASGAAWVRLAERTVVVSPGLTPRVQGLFQNEKLFGTEAPVAAMVPADAGVEAVFFKVDDGPELEVKPAAALPGEGPLSTMHVYAMGGREPTGAVRPASFITLPDGLHTVTATARYAGGTLSARAVHFTLSTGASGPVGFAADVAPIFMSRCANCHTTGPGRDLSSFELWQRNSSLILNAVRDRRMPADGPLDPVFIQKIARWVNGGMQP